MKYITNCFVLLMFVLVFALAFWYATSPEVWYAGMHDSKCNGSENCGCYERLVANDK